MVQKEQERGKGSTTGSFERAKPSRLNRSQSSRTWLVGSRQGWIPIDNGGGIVESRPGTHCAHPLTMPDYYPPLVCFVGSRSNGILLRSLELSDDPCSVFTMGSSMRPRANRFENAHVRNDKTKFILYATASIKVIEVPPSRCTRLSFSRCSHIEQRVTFLRNANGFQVDVNRGGVQEDRRDRILKIGIQ